MRLVIRLVKTIALLSSWNAVQGTFHDGNISAPCDSPLYCFGQVLQDIQLARPFADSKTFVDMPTKRPLEDVLSAYYQLQKPLQNDSQLQAFLSDNFAMAGSELVPVPTENLTTNATFLRNLSNPIITEFVQLVIDIWPDLTRTYNSTSACEFCQSSFIPVERPFVVAGGRFREAYYWDSYWIIQGLVRTGGSFIDISRNQVENFLDFVETFGFVPNGARQYYLNRSQPPFLAQMVRVYVDYTGDTSILQRAIPLLIREHDFFERNRSVPATVCDRTYTLQRYNVDNNQPRPESFREDWQQVNNATYYARNGNVYPARNLTEDEKSVQYKNLASGAESGWDFTSRFLREPQAAIADTSFPLASINIVNMIPVDLNSILYWNEATIASLLTRTGNSSEASKWEDLARTRSEAMAAVMWNEEFGSYFDYNTTSNSSYMFTARDNDALPIETMATPSDDVQISFNVAQLLPFLTGAALPAIKNNPSTVRRAFQRVSDYLFRDAEVGGVHATNFRTTQQWDQPNVWPPLMQMLMEGLLNTPPTNGEEDEDWIWTQDLALALGQRYLDSAYCTWRATGGSSPSSPKLDGLNSTTDKNGLIFEKYSADSLNEAGGGGEYEVVVGFGWTNGVLIWVADTFGDRLQTPGCAANQSISDFEASPQASSGGSRRTRDIRKAGPMERERSAIQLDPWDAKWTAKWAGGVA